VNWRPYIVAGTLITVLGVDLYLAAAEDIQGSQDMKNHNVLDQDPLFDIVYSPPERLVNLRRFGLSETEVEDLSRRIARLESNWSDYIKTLLEKAPEPDALSAALCGEGARGLPPRWGAMDFLVEEKDGGLAVVDLSDYALMESHGWLADHAARSVYTKVERRASRVEDATRIGFVAIFAGAHEALLKGESPWGSGFFGGSDWGEVSKQYPAATKQLYEYLPLMHLTLELARAEGGICRS